MNKIKVLSFIVFILWTFSACDSTAEPTPTNSQPIIPSITPSLAQSNTPSPIPTRTLIPTLTGTPTLTPLPTLLAEEKLQIVENLFMNNAGCDLPCWWGFIPGETRWDLARQELAQYAHKISEQERQEGLLAIPSFKTSQAIFYGEYGWIDTEYLINDGVISQIRAFVPSKVPTFNLTNLFRRYGEPDMISVFTSPHVLSSVETSQVDLIMLFKEHGFVAHFWRHGDRYADDTKIWICFGNTGPVILYIQDSTIDLSFDSFDGWIGGINQPTEYPLEDYTTYSVNQFYKQVMNGDLPVCIDLTLEDFEPQE